MRTPTAVIADLGTEFGVEVGEDASTTSHVFQGRVLITVLGGNHEETLVLGEDESAVISHGKVEVRRQSEAAVLFARSLQPSPFPGLVDMASWALVFCETFDRDTQDAAADYPEFRFDSGDISAGAGRTEAVVLGGVFQLRREGGGKGRGWNSAMTVRRFSGSLIVAVNLGADPSSIGDSAVALRLGELALVFHPGLAQWHGHEARGIFRVERCLPNGKGDRGAAEYQFGFSFPCGLVAPSVRLLRRQRDLARLFCRWRQPPQSIPYQLY